MVSDKRFIVNCFICFQILEAQFFDRLTDAFDVRNVPLQNIMKLDQTSVQYVNREKRTIEKVGAKEVPVFNPPDEKEHFTVTLVVKANGEKIPAIVAFRGAKKTGQLSDRNGLKPPTNVIVNSSGKAWWTKELDKQWTWMDNKKQF